MPMYEYRCATCGKVFELIQRFSDAQLEVHPGCGGPVERLISASGFRLKGSGWYATDYAKSSSKSEGSGSEAKSSSEAKSEGDAKPAGDSKPASDAKPASESKPAATTATKTD